jgi:hypothetical protein
MPTVAKLQAMAASCCGEKSESLRPLLRTCICRRKLKDHVSIARKKISWYVHMMRTWQCALLIFCSVGATCHAWRVPQKESFNHLQHITNDCHTSTRWKRGNLRRRSLAAPQTTLAKCCSLNSCALARRLCSTHMTRL